MMSVMMVASRAVMATVARRRVIPKLSVAAVRNSLLLREGQEWLANEKLCQIIFDIINKKCHKGLTWRTKRIKEAKVMKAMRLNVDWTLFSGPICFPTTVPLPCAEIIPV
jgi:hypothetical protein